MCTNCWAGGAPVTEASLSVVILARPGAARDRLETAVGDAGASLLGTVDPLDGDATALIDLAPQAVLVALEPAVEDALDAFQALLWDPAVAVIYEEADLIVQRDGWEAARWQRHLSAKLHRHDDVLPPGAEPVPTEAPAASSASVSRTVGDETGSGAAAHATSHAIPARDHEGERGDFDANGDARDLDFGVLALDDDGESVSTLDLDEIALGGSPLGDVVLDIDSGDGTATPGPGAAGPWDAVDGLADTEAAPDTSPDDRAEPSQASSEAVREDLSAGLDWDMPWGTGQGTVPASAEVADVTAPSPGLPTGAGLSLAERDDTPLGVAGAVPDPRLADLDERIGGLSLVDVESYGHGPLRGAVLVEGGLGGPDAVRQLLAAVPETFPRALLVRLRLDGGRYDRLVRQMARATALQVALAEPGGAVEPGTVYFLSPDLGLVAERGQLRFADEPGASGRWPAALPGDDSAAVFLSGADAALVPHAIQGGNLVIAQTLDGCYDPAASAAVVEQGGELAEPGALAAVLVRRWNPGGHASDIELETTDD